jgi:D-alanyl-D-alanine endopeptidase (penicillin-binding protein 7)
MEKIGSHSKEKKYYYLVGLAALTVVLFLFLLLHHPVVSTLETDSFQEVKKEIVLKNLSLEAKAALVIDLENSQTIYGFNEDVPLPLASLTKIMTALVSLDEHAPISKEMYANLLVISSNQAALTIGKESGGDFIQKMNAKARELKLSNTYFLNESGVDSGNILAGGYGSARDVITMLAHGLATYPEVFELSSHATIATKNGLLTNTNLLAGTLPGLLTSKTGTTALSGGNLAIILGWPSKTIGIVVLGGTEEGRFHDVTTITQALLLKM